MSSYKEKFPSKFLRAVDLPKPILVTIEKVTDEEVGDDIKPVAHFHGEEKALGLNLTNCRSIEEIAGTDDVDGWEGKAIVLFKTQTDYQGRRVDCVRIRAPKPGAKLPEPEPEPDGYEDDSIPF
jgi:hypothetical protein